MVRNARCRSHHNHQVQPPPRREKIHAHTPAFGALLRIPHFRHAVRKVDTAAEKPDLLRSYFCRVRDQKSHASSVSIYFLHSTVKKKMPEGLEFVLRPSGFWCLGRIVERLPSYSSHRVDGTARLGSWVLTLVLVCIINHSRSLSSIFLAKKYFNIHKKFFYKNKRKFIISFLLLDSSGRAPPSFYFCSSVDLATNIQAGSEILLLHTLC